MLDRVRDVRRGGPRLDHRAAGLRQHLAAAADQGRTEQQLEGHDAPLDLSLTTASVTGKTVTLVASARGGQPGDVVRLSGRRNGVNLTLATGILGPEGTVTFQVQQETEKARYGALLVESDEHTSDKAAVVVIKPKTPKDDDEDTPSPSP